MFENRRRRVLRLAGDYVVLLEKAESSIQKAVKPLGITGLNVIYMEGV